MTLAKWLAPGLVPSSRALGQCKADVRGNVFGLDTPGKAGMRLGFTATFCVTSGKSLNHSEPQLSEGNSSLPLPRTVRSQGDSRTQQGMDTVLYDLGCLRLVRTLGVWEGVPGAHSSFSKAGPLVEGPCSHSSSESMSTSPDPT